MNRLQQPDIKPLDHYRLSEPEVFHLKNGIRVVQFNAGTQDLVRIELIFNAGSWYQAQNFTSLATNLMLREGTSKYSSREISDLLDFYGAHLETSAEKDNAYISLYTLNKHLPYTLPILEEIVKNASFPENEFRIFAGKQRQLLEVNLEKVNFVARTRFNGLIYGKSHPYGNYLSPEDIDRFDTGSMHEFYRKYYHQGNSVIMAAGKIPDGLPDMLNNSFGDVMWNHSAVEDREMKIEASPEREQLITREKAVQSAIRIGRIMVNRHHPDYKGLRVLNTLLGGYFGSRLMTNLREDKGYTYGIGSAVVPLRHSGYFFISCEVGRDVTGNALTEIQKELLRLCDERIPEDELNLVRNYMLGSFLRGIDGPFAMADTYRDIMEDGLDNEFHYSLLEVIKNISPTELQDLACRYLNPSEMHQLVVGQR